MKRIAVYVVVLFMLVACKEINTTPLVDEHGWAKAKESDLSQVKLGFLTGSRLKDPTSVLFLDVHMKKIERFMVYCGKYNAKNGFGAYVGFEPFAARDLPALGVYVDYLDEVHIWSEFVSYTYCRDAPENRHLTDEQFDSLVKSYRSSD